MPEYRLDFSKIRTYPLKTRKSKVNRALFSRSCPKGATIKEFLKSLPDILAVKNLRELARAIAAARRRRKPVIFGVGAHVIKCGLGPVLIELVRDGWISAFAMNGATAIHDFEIALAGRTSEDVDEALSDGSFGMAEETGRLINDVWRQGLEKGEGAGEALCRLLKESTKFRYKKLSLLAQCGAAGIPVTIHIAVGTDIIHQHPACDGAVLGAASMADFRRFCGIVAGMGGGGVFVNAGSNVILPEVFLKALSVARNLTGIVNNFVTANLDMIRHYRPSENVLRRPILEGGKSYSIIGHHEIMIPLLAAAIRET